MINVTLHQLNVLNAVRATGSITAAAHALHITQPAVSNILKQLSLCCNCPVTETIGKKVFLTKAGERLVKASKSITEALEHAESDIDAINARVSGTMTVVIVSTAKYFVPKVLGAFRQKYPLVRIKLTVCNRQDAIRILKENACDFVIMSQPPDNMLIKKQLFYEDSLVVVGSAQMKCKGEIGALTGLSDEDWIIREPGSGTRIVMQRIFKQHKISPNIAMEVGNNEAIKQLIIANMGISIVSRRSVELELKHNLLTILPVDGFPLKHPWSIVMSKGKHITPVIAEFFDFDICGI